MKTITEFEQQLTEACAIAEQNGRQIVPDDYRTRVRGDVCCPLGAMHNFCNYPCADSVVGITGLEIPQLSAFINGFSGDSADKDYAEPRFFALGRKFRTAALQKLDQ